MAALLASCALEAQSGAGPSRTLPARSVDMVASSLQASRATRRTCGATRHHATATHLAFDPLELLERVGRVDASAANQSGVVLRCVGSAVRLAATPGRA
jgi:hypothetical protein